MCWEAILGECDYQFALFDFGRSTKGEGTYEFKMQWGSVQEPLHCQHFLESVQGDVPQIQKDRYSRLISLWAQLPVSVTKIIGPWIREQIPL